MLRFKANFYSGNLYQEHIFDVIPKMIETTVSGENEVIPAPTIKPYVIPLGTMPMQITIEFECEVEESLLLENLVSEDPIEILESDYLELNAIYKYYIDSESINVIAGSDQDSVTLTLITAWEDKLANGWELYLHSGTALDYIFPVSKVEVEKIVNDINKARVEIILSREQLLADYKPIRDIQGFWGVQKVYYYLTFDGDIVFTGFLDKIEGENKNRMTVLLKEPMNDLKFMFIANPDAQAKPSGVIGWFKSLLFKSDYSPFKVALPNHGGTWSLHRFLDNILNLGKSGWLIHKDLPDYVVNPVTGEKYSNVTFELVPILHGLQHQLKDMSGLDFWANTQGGRLIYYDVNENDFNGYYNKCNRFIHYNYEYHTVSITSDKYYDNVERVYVFSENQKEYGTSDGYTQYSPMGEPDTGKILVFKSQDGFLPRMWVLSEPMLALYNEISDEPIYEPYDIYTQEHVARTLVNTFRNMKLQRDKRTGDPQWGTKIYVADYVALARQIFEQIDKRKETFTITKMVSIDRYDDTENVPFNRHGNGALKWNINEGDIINFKYVRNPILANEEKYTGKVVAVKINNNRVDIEFGAPKNSFFDLIDRKLTEINIGGISGDDEYTYSNSGELI